LEQRLNLSKLKEATGVSGLVGESCSGKTTLAIKKIVDDGIILKRPIIYLSLEYTIEYVINKIISEMSGLSMNSLLKGELTNEEKEEVSKCIDTIKECDNVILLSGEDVSFDNLNDKINTLKKKFDEDICVIVDYMQLLRDIPDTVSNDIIEELSINSLLNAQVEEFFRLKNEENINSILIFNLPLHVINNDSIQEHLPLSFELDSIIKIS